MEITRANGSKVFIDPEKQLVVASRRKVTFTNSEWTILTYLYEHKGEVVPRENLIKILWGDRDVAPTRTIDVHISSIRKKLLLIKGVRIDSYYGTGYRLLVLKRI